MNSWDFIVWCINCLNFSWQIPSFLIWMDTSKFVELVGYLAQFFSTTATTEQVSIGHLADVRPYDWLPWLSALSAWWTPFLTEQFTEFIFAQMCLMDIHFESAVSLLWEHTDLCGMKYSQVSWRFNSDFNLALLSLQGLCSSFCFYWSGLINCSCQSHIVVRKSEKKQTYTLMIDELVNQDHWLISSTY